MSVHALGARIADRYEVVTRRSGGMGVVYLCLDRREDCPVALKTFKPEYLPDRDARDRFLREGTLWVELGRHPHVVRAWRVEHLGDTREVFIVLDWVAPAEGKRDASLRAWLAPGRPLAPEQALLFALHIARGMRHATGVRHDLVHRDLKPENVLVGRDGQARVTDFGLASTLIGLDRAGPASAIGSQAESGSAVSRTQLTHGLAGTPLYMAPEQWGVGDTVDARADIYALGCILYELLAGAPAAEGQHRKDLERVHRAGRLRPLPPGLGPAVRDVVRRCMALRPEDRFGSWVELESALAEAFAAEAGHAPPGELVGEAQTRAERVAAGWSLNEIGNGYMDISKFEVAGGYFERAMQVGRVDRSRELECAGLGNLARTSVDLGDLGHAEAQFDRALAMAREIGDRAKEGASLGGLGSVWGHRGDKAKAIAFHEQHLAIARQSGDRAAEGAALGNLGDAYLFLGNPQQAIGLFGQQMAAARAVGDRVAEGRAMGGLGLAYRAVGDATQAIDYLRVALQLAQESGDRAMIGAVQGNLGNAYLNLDDLPRALECYQQQLAVAQELEQRVVEGIALGNLGNAYWRLGDMPRALDLSQQAMAIARETGNRAEEARAAGNLANAFRGLGQIGEASRCYGQQLAIAQELGDAMNVGRASSNLASLLAAQGRFSEALAHAQRARDVFNRIGHTTYARHAQKLMDDIGDDLQRETG